MEENRQTPAWEDRLRKIRNLYVAAFLITSGGSRLEKVEAFRDTVVPGMHKPIVTEYHLRGGADSRIIEAFHSGQAQVQAKPYGLNIKHLLDLREKAARAVLQEERRALWEKRSAREVEAAPQRTNPAQSDWAISEPDDESAPRL